MTSFTNLKRCTNVPVRLKGAGVESHQTVVVPRLRRLVHRLPVTIVIRV